MENVKWFVENFDCAPASVLYKKFVLYLTKNIFFKFLPIIATKNMLTFNQNIFFSLYTIFICVCSCIGLID